MKHVVGVQPVHPKDVIDRVGRGAVEVAHVETDLVAPTSVSQRVDVAQTWKNKIKIYVVLI
jgi:hypothetical protein